VVFLPFPDPLGIFFVTEIFFVSQFCQPNDLAISPSSLLAPRLGAESLAVPVAVIRKKIFLAVQAVAAALLSVHWLNNQTNHSRKNQSKEGRKSRRRKIKTAKKEENFSVNCSKKTQAKKIHF